MNLVHDIRVIIRQMKLLLTTYIFRCQKEYLLKCIAIKLSNVSLHNPALHRNNQYEKHFGSDYWNNFLEH